MSRLILLSLTSDNIYLTDPPIYMTLHQREGTPVLHLKGKKNAAYCTILMDSAA